MCTANVCVCSPKQENPRFGASGPAAPGNLRAKLRFFPADGCTQGDDKSDGLVHAAFAKQREDVVHARLCADGRSAVRVGSAV